MPPVVEPKALQPAEHIKKDVYPERGKQLFVQSKLTVGAPNDPYEHEAEAVADKVMQMPEQNFLQRKCAHCKEEEKKQVQRKPISQNITTNIQAKGEAGASVSNSLSNKINASQGSGSRMDGNTQSFMQSRFGSNFNNVKIHTDGDAVQMNRTLNAKAFTTGNDIYFNEGQYQPGTDRGKHLLAHELTHTIQQNNNFDAIQRACSAEDLVKYDVTAAEIKALPYYLKAPKHPKAIYTPIEVKTKADNIIKKAKDRDNCLYYIEYLKTLFSTDEAPPGAIGDEFKKTLSEGADNEKARLDTDPGKADKDFEENAKDVYTFFLKLGPVSNTQSAKYFNHKSYIWDEYLQHDTYDDYWKARNIRPHLKNISIPTLVVGGWFDAEDLFGALNTYSSIEKQSPQNTNRLVMGPWTHGGWESAEWNKYASYDFGSNTSKYFQDSLEAMFFNFYLKDKGVFNAAEATVFETGSNIWTSYSSWPPANIKYVDYFLNDRQQLSTKKENGNSFDEYESDPNKPVPYTNGVYAGRNNDYMAEDQRFAALRPDVLVYETPTLTEDVTLAGKINADLQVSITGTDADFVVKLIDVLPETEPNFKNAPRGFQMAGYQRLVRAEVMRGKFRNSYEKPEAFEPNKISNVKFDLNDVAHTFKKGHKIMMQVQSSWFPLVDRNPQKFMRIPDAAEKDFQKAGIRIYHSSKIVLPVLSK